MGAQRAVFQDRNGLSVLDREECLDLLRETAVGRVAVTIGALPVILPVNFAISPAGEVVFRTGDGQKLRSALDDAVVAFEADDFDPITRSGWSVLVQDRAQVLGPIDGAAYSDLPLETWATIEPSTVVVLRTDLISGRRLEASGQGRNDHC